MFAISAQTLTARPVALRARSAAPRAPRAVRIVTAAAKKDAPKEEPKEEDSQKLRASTDDLFR